MDEFVSILMTVYNSAGRCLSESILGVLNQSYRKFEFIIVNDGSNDSTESIIGDFAKRDNRIVFINRKENRGRVYSLNEGLSLAKGKLLFINDSDDVSRPSRIYECLEFYEKHIRRKDRFGLLGTAFYVNYYDHTVEHSLKFGTIGKMKFPMWRLLVGMPFPHSSIMYSTEVLRSVGGFPQTVSSSIDYFTLLIIGNKYDIYGINRLLMERRVDGKNYFMSKEMTQRNMLNMQTINRWCKDNIRFYLFKVFPRVLREKLLISRKNVD